MGGIATHHQQGYIAKNVAKVEDIISVDAQVEIRIKPDQIRIVLAITEGAETPLECEQKVFSKIESLRNALIKLGVPKQDIVDDFIAILPRYEFVIETIEGQKVAVEKLKDYHIQSNLHVQVLNDEMAMKAIRSAFQLNVTDIISFDYWSKEIDSVKEKALDLALSKVESKSKKLFGATFQAMPTPINVTSETEVILPPDLYASFENSFSQTLTQRYNRNREQLPEIRAFRPKHTFYKGYTNKNLDVNSKHLAMSCEITVVSNVRQYFASPVAKEYRILESNIAKK